MQPPPPTVETGSTCRATLKALRTHGADCVIVVDATGRPVGIVTEHDVAHEIGSRVPPETAIDEVMIQPVHYIGDEDYLFHAIARMCRYGFHHMPVVDRSVRVVGLLRLSDVLAASMPRMLDLVDRLTHEESISGLKKVKVAQFELAGALLDDRVPAPEVQALLTHINNDLCRRIVERCVSDMAQRGWGAPPVPFAVLVMGSGGRGENFLGPDQDNGFLLGDYVEKRHATIDTWFIELAERMTRCLDDVGFAPCRGHVMATNPVWRKSLSDWQRQLGFWIHRRSPFTLRLCDIFFDFSPVYGDHDLASALRGFVTEVIAKNFLFLEAMYHEQRDHDVALGVFGKLVADSGDASHRGMIDMKYHALLPLVEAVRLLALKEGVSETSTLARLAALNHLGTVSRDEHDYLSAALHQLTALVLDQQIEDFTAGRPISNHVPRASLSRSERDALELHLQAIRNLRARVREVFTASMS
jgi:CBS domain-containing protein